MPSPFPGIDPYLESQGHWLDFLARFVPGLADAINERLPEDYLARIDERMTLVELPHEDQPKLIRPDVSVIRGESSPGPRSTASLSQSAVTLEPVTVPMKFLEVESKIYLEILHLSDQKVVTIVELLSPSNKGGAGRRDYLAKRHALITPDVHLVELDFLVGGHRLPMERPLPPADSFALVARLERRPDCDVFAWTVRDRLPTIPIPLLAPDPDIVLDLAPAFASVYERGRYARLIKYEAPLNLPLSPDARAWAAEVAASAVH
jgi:Protein of unknown function (DUF4058)